MRIVAVRFPAGSRVTFENAAREVHVHPQAWMLEGPMDVALGDERHRLHAGDCFAMRLDRATTFRNPTRKIAHYAVVVASGGAGRR